MPERMLQIKIYSQQWSNEPMNVWPVPDEPTHEDLVEWAFHIAGTWGIAGMSHQSVECSFILDGESVLEFSVEPSSGGIELVWENEMGVLCQEHRF